VKISSETFLNGLQDKTMRKVRVILAAVLLLTGFCAAGPLGGGGSPLGNSGVPGMDLLRATEKGIVVRVDHPTGKSDYYSPSADTDTARGASLVAAKTAAASGDTIHVGPGAYAITEALAKNGVNWHFDAGATVTATGAGIWDDGGSAMSFTVSGDGNFISNQYVVSPMHASSVLVIHCQSMYCTAKNTYGAIGGGGVGGPKGMAFITATKELKAEYDTILTNGTGGTFYITCPYMWAADNCVESSNTLYLNIDKMESDGNSVINGGLNGYWRVKELYTTGSVGVNIPSGTGILDFDLIQAANVGVEVQGGTWTLKNGIIKQTGIGDTAAIGVESDEGFTLQNVSLIANASANYAITSYGDAYPVNFKGVIHGNKPLDPALVVSGAGIYYDSSTSVLTIESLLPRGVVVMWSGTIATIPDGWALCDGSNGTPDLRNKFIVCANADDGGVAKTTVTGTALQSGGAIRHQHSAALNIPAGTVIASGSGYDSVVDGSTDDETEVPPFFALAYIMKL
jgi:hypothetical protein